MSDPFWKKELTLRRKPKDAAPAATPGAPFWKKELRLRKSTSAPVAVEAVAAEAVAEAAVVAPEAPTVVQAPPVSAPVSPEPVYVPVGRSGEHSWLTAPLDQVSLPPGKTHPQRRRTDLPAPPVEAPLPVEEAVALLPVPAPAPAPEVVVPAPAPPAPVAEVPAPEPVPQPEPQPEPIPLPGPPPSPDPLPAASAPKIPFHKREVSLSLRRRRKDADEAADTVPFYRRELSLKRPQGTAKERTPRPSLSLRRAPSNHIVGLKIGASQLAASVVDNGARELVQAVREPLEYGIVVGGELRDPEALAAALDRFFAKHKLPRRGIRLGIANNRVGVRTFDLEGIDDPKQLANAVRFRAQEVLPIPIDEAVLDYQILGVSPGEDGRPVHKILLVVAYRELVDRYVTACREANLHVTGVDLEAFALLRAIAEPIDLDTASPTRGALVAVSVGHDRSTFAVSDGRVCEFTRVLDWGGSALNVAIARALDVAPSEAEPVKLALSFNGVQPAPPAGVSPERMAAARAAAQKQLETFARELVSSLQFYQAQPGSLGIAEIVLTGGTAHLHGLRGELERLIAVPVRIGDPFARMKVSKRVKEREQVGSLAVAIGLGIED